MDKISYLYRNLLNSNDFYKIYIKKNSLKQFNVSMGATNKLHKTTLPDNTSESLNKFNTLIKNNQKIIDDKKNISNLLFDDEDNLNNTDNKKNNNKYDFDDDFDDDYDPDDFCESILSDSKDYLDYEVYDM